MTLNTASTLGWTEFRADSCAGNARHAWEDFLDDQLYRLEFQSSTDAVRALEGRSVQESGFQIVDFATTGEARLLREPPAHLHALDQRFVFQFPISGGLAISQFGDMQSAAPGEFFLVDAREVYEQIRRDARFAGFVIDASTIEEHLVDPHSFCGRSFRCDGGTAKLARGLVFELVEHGGAMDSAEFSACARAALDLLMAFVARQADRDATSGSALLATRRRLHRHIWTNCRDASLTPSALAESSAMSVRHLHELFEGSGVTVGGLIRRERLKLARRLLQDPRFARRTVTEIAFDSGFVNLSHFSTAFREEFGLSPRELRKKGTKQVEN